MHANGSSHPRESLRESLEEQLASELARRIRKLRWLRNSDEAEPFEHALYCVRCKRTVLDGPRDTD
jgi:hypothetical protein